MTVRLLARAWVAAFFMFYAMSAAACPCGCGAVGPLVLWPGEAWKLQVGVNREAIAGFVDDGGRLGGNGGAETSDSLQLGVAKSVSDTLSLSLNATGKRESAADVGSEWGVADPSLGLRYIAQQNDYERPWIPQVHLHATYKYALDNWRDGSAQGSRLEGDSLNASEFVPGVDLWFYRGELALGVGQALEYRRSVAVDAPDQPSSLRESGLGWRTSLGVSYTFIGWGQLVTTLEREVKGRDRQDGQQLAASERLQHALSLGANLRVGDRKTLAVTSRLVAPQFISNKNTKRSQAFGVSYIQAI